jgi:hypothetical protein
VPKVKFKIMEHLQDVEVGEAKKHFLSKGLKPVPVQEEVLKKSACVPK